jgi:hypothetical protein
MQAMWDSDEHDYSTDGEEEDQEPEEPFEDAEANSDDQHGDDDSSDYPIVDYAGVLIKAERDV